MFLCIDVTLLQKNRILFVDHFSFSTNTPVSSFWATNYNFITGMAYVQVPCRNKMFGYAGMTASDYNPLFSFSCSAST